MKKKYYAINWYDNQVWVESGEYNTSDEAELDLARNNPQIILTYEEMKKVIEAVAEDFPISNLELK